MPEFSLEQIVTSLINSDGTITIAPAAGVGNLTASLALSHANTWTTAQIFQAITQTSGITGGIHSLSSGSPYSVVSTDEILLITTGSSAYTVTLPAANQYSGRKLLIAKVDSGSGAVTINRAGSDTISGQTSVVLSAQYAMVGLVSDDVSVWYNLGSGAVISVSNSDGTLTISPTTGLVVASIATGGVTATQLASNAVTTVKINAAAVTAAKLGAVTDGSTIDQSGTGSTIEVIAGGITATQLATNAVTAVKINAAAVTTAKLGAQAVTAEKLGNTLRLTGNTSGSNGTKSTGLTWSLAASTNYCFKGFLTVTTGAAATLNFQIHALASGAALEVIEATAINNGALSTSSSKTGIISAVTTNIFASSLAAGTTYYIIMTGVITVGTTLTTLQLDMVDTVTTSTVNAGSFIEVSEIN